jgi:hypothetical protein
MIRGSAIHIAYRILAAFSLPSAVYRNLET